VTISPQQRAQLLRTKLAALARDQGASDGEPTDLGTSAALVTDRRAWVLLERGTAAGLAGALLWASRQGAAELTVFVDDAAAADVARWAEYFVLGDRPVAVRQVRAATSHEVPPAPLPTKVPTPDLPAEIAAQLRDSGAEVVVEQGVVRAEVLGLEVGRVVRWPTEVGGDDQLHLEAGVGRFDRDAVAAARPDEAPAEALRSTVEQVRAHRHPGAAVHPLQLLSRSRWLRSMVVADPSLVGATVLEPADMTTEQTGLKDVHPAAATGVDLQGRALVVVCSTGVDLALVPLAADTRELHDPDARLVLALPGRDHHSATVTLAGLLRHGAELVDLAPGWA
jgi:hypothetical protein